ncbi:MAG: hypothetical protein KC486_07575 [Myxococcales bacterium]|nr:hypothetical protein [Myxococcales bacterium]
MSHRSALSFSVVVVVALGVGCSGDDASSTSSDSATTSATSSPSSGEGTTSSTGDDSTATTGDAPTSTDATTTSGSAGTETDATSTSDSATTGGSDSDTGVDPLECAAADPAWIFCDDFESGAPLVADGRYFEYGDDDGDFAVVDGAGFGGSAGMRAHFEATEVDAGSLKLGFGRNPNAYMNRGVRDDEDFREIWYRMYLRSESGWTGDPAKLSRATVFTSADDWSQAMIAHLWGDGAEHLLLDPVSCVDGDQVICQGYNDFGNMKWLGFAAGPTPVFSTALSDQWFCVEAHVRLNDPGEANGVHEFWIDGVLEARREDLDFVGGYTDYALNAVFFENYWNDGAVQEQSRDFDNIIISTAPIGCL